jgi:hypothetical protein
MILRVSSSAQQLNLRHPKENCRQQQNVVLFKKILLLFLLSHYISVSFGTMGKQPTD